MIEHQHQVANTLDVKRKLTRVAWCVEHVFSPGRQGTTYLVDLDDGVFVLRPSLVAGTGVDQVVQCGSGTDDSARQLLHHGRHHVRALVPGDVLEWARAPRRRPGNR